MLSIQNCNYRIVGFGLILILTTNIEILYMVNVCTYVRMCVHMYILLQYMRMYVCL